jgi:hypothetical protein
MNYKYFYFYLHTLKMGANDASGEGLPLRTIPRLDLSEFANLAEFVVFSLGDQIHPGRSLLCALYCAGVSCPSFLMWLC